MPDGRAGFREVEVADFDGDGKLDVAASNYNSSSESDRSNVHVYFGNGDGTLRDGPVTGVLHSGKRTIVADLDTDGRPDLARIDDGRDGRGPGISVLMGVGDGTFKDALVMPLPTQPYGLAAADFPAASPGTPSSLWPGVTATAPSSRPRTFRSREPRWTWPYSTLSTTADSTSPPPGRRILTHSAAARGRWVPPEQVGTADVESFLNQLVGERRLAASTQNQALNALVFLYRHVLEGAIARDHLGKFELLRSTPPARVPTVLSAADVARVLEALPPKRIVRLMAELLYGTGMRVSECCTLRVRDIDLGRAQIIVRAGKGDKDRVVMLPASLRGSLTAQLRRVEALWRRDVGRGGGYAPVPDALQHKRPRAGRELPFQFVFPSAILHRQRRRVHGRLRGPQCR
jgi:integrase